MEVVKGLCPIGMHISTLAYCLMQAAINQKRQFLRDTGLLAGLYKGLCIVLASILSPTQYAGYWSIQCAYTCIASQPV